MVRPCHNERHTARCRDEDQRRGPEDPQRSGLRAALHGPSNVRVHGKLTGTIFRLHQIRDGELGQGYPRAGAQTGVTPHWGAGTTVCNSPAGVYWVPLSRGRRILLTKLRTLPLQLHIDRRTAPERLIDDAIPLREFEQLVQLLLWSVGLDVEAKTDLREPDG